jgi:uncharacterized linocin/CFP29 family protein
MMDARNAQVGWNDAQWNRVREEVIRAWQTVRVAGSVLPIYGPLPPSTQVVPSEIMRPDGTVDERSVAPLLEVRLPVTLSRQQVKEEDLTSGLLQFRRRAAQLGQLEDWYIFNGTYPYDLPPSIQQAVDLTDNPYRPRYPFLRNLNVGIKDILKGMPEPIGEHKLQRKGLVARNPGTLGLIAGAKELDSNGDPDSQWSIRRNELRYATLLDAVVNAISALEQHGYVAPYMCLFGRDLFAAAYQPLDHSTALPRDRLKPLIGREILHASALDIPSEGGASSEEAEWPRRGLLISLAGEAVDLAMAAEATPEFEYVDQQGRYVFAVFERFALRIKDPRAIVPIHFKMSSGTYPRTSSGGAPGSPRDALRTTPRSFPRAPRRLPRGLIRRTRPE